MDLIKLKSSNNTENKITSQYNTIKEELWWWIVLAVIVAIVLIVIMIWMRKFIEGPIYTKSNRLDEEVVIITGCNRGIGKETAWEMARRGARVYMACRNYEKCEEARREIIKNTKNPYVFNRSLDLASLKSVREFVQQFLKEEQRLDILINNAAVISKSRQLSKEGYELHFATNHLGHFLLTNLLMDILKKSEPSRIVVITSSAFSWWKLKKNDLQWEKSYIWFLAFLQSKYCNTLFTLKMAELLKDSQVTINCLYPGLVRTDLIYKNIWCLFHPLIQFFSKSVRAGAQTSIYLALEPNVQKWSGGYYERMQKSFMPSWVKNRELAEWLWQESLKMVELEGV